MKAGSFHLFGFHVYGRIRVHEVEHVGTLLQFPYEQVLLFGEWSICDKEGGEGGVCEAWGHVVIVKWRG